MSSKRYYNESHIYHDTWYRFLNEQGGDPMADQAAAQQAAAQQAAQQKEAELMAVRQNAGPVFSEFAAMMVQAGDAGDDGSKVADVHIRNMDAIFSDLAHKEIGVEEFLKKISDEVGQTGQDIQGAMPK
jgi:hypothetical protein